MSSSADIPDIPPPPESSAAPAKGPVTPKRAPWRSRRALLVVALLLLAGAGIGAWWYVWSLTHESTDDAFIDGHITPISPRIDGHIAGVLVQDNQWVTKGTPLIELDPRDNQAKLAAAQAALEAARAQQKSQKLKSTLTGTTTAAMLDQTKAGVSAAQAAVQAAEAQVEAAKAGLAQARAAVEVAQADADEAAAQVAAHQADAKRDEADLQRAEQLLTHEAISPQDLDHAKATAESSRAKLAAAQKTTAAAAARVNASQAAQQTAQSMINQANASLAQAKGQLAEAQAKQTAAESAPTQVAQSAAEVSVSDAQIEQAQAALTQAQLNLSYTKIDAPCDGWVTHKSAQVGQYVEKGQSLMAIVLPNVWVVANFKETQLTDIRPGQPVTISVDAYPGMTLRGRVDSIQAGAGARFSLLPPENATGNYIKVVQRVPVKITFDQGQEINRDKLLLGPGMSVVPTIDTANTGGAMTLHEAPTAGGLAPSTPASEARR